MEIDMLTLLWVIAGFACVHLFKMIRLYLVLMEHKIPFGRFVLLYFRTTLVNLLIPFKLGEVYRVEEVWRMTGIWQVGLLSVVVDRYFDILALFLWLLPMDILLSGKLSGVTPVFGVLILAGLVLYLAIPGSHTYLNRFLIKKRASVRSMAALSALDVVKKWYDFTANLVTGRAFLIIITSAAGWGAEIVTLKKLSVYLGINYRFRDFGKYIDSIFLRGGKMEIQQTYTLISVVVVAVITAVGTVIWAAKRINKQDGTAV
ncbi:MAG: flippase-like domain-containing protein [Lachnospiraceae bacterium]|nr:flippase-like domain-containing protein [Lachnospiraceae bacterium]